MRTLLPEDQNVLFIIKTSPPSKPPRMTPTGSSSGRMPLYLALAKQLLLDIKNGRYPIGGALPTEETLARQHDVSRHTVRQAMRELKEEGVIWSRGGVGTLVRAKPEAPKFLSGINTISDLLQFVDATEMQVISSAEIEADADTALLLRCSTGQVWTEFNVVRTIPGETKPLSYLQVFLRPLYADIIGIRKVLHAPIYAMVEEAHGIRIVEILQDITATNLTKKIARALKAEPGQPALQITRYYLDKGGTIIEVSVGYYPSGRYTQSTRFRAHAQED